MIKINLVHPPIPGSINSRIFRNDEPEIDEEEIRCSYFPCEDIKNCPNGQDENCYGHHPFKFSKQNKVYQEKKQNGKQ